jgi:hypothetical protein
MIRAMMQLRGINSTGLAAALGYSNPKSVNNIIEGYATGNKARRRLSDFFGKDFWGLSPTPATIPVANNSTHSRKRSLPKRAT